MLVDSGIACGGAKIVLMNAEDYQPGTTGCKFRDRKCCISTDLFIVEAACLDKI